MNRFPNQNKELPFNSLKMSMCAMYHLECPVLFCTSCPVPCPVSSPVSCPVAQPLLFPGAGRRTQGQDRSQDGGQDGDRTKGRTRTRDRTGDKQLTFDPPEPRCCRRRGKDRPTSPRSHPVARPRRRQWWRRPGSIHIWVWDLGLSPNGRHLQHVRLPSNAVLKTKTARDDATHLGCFGVGLQVLEFRGVFEMISKSTNTRDGGEWFSMTSSSTIWFEPQKRTLREKQLQGMVRRVLPYWEPAKMQRSVSRGLVFCCCCCCCG